MLAGTKHMPGGPLCEYPAALSILRKAIELTFWVCLVSQPRSSLPWMRRRDWMYAITDTVAHRRSTVLTAPVDSEDDLGTTITPGHYSDSDLTALLRDYRITRAAGSFVSSHLVGTALSFLSHCCERPVCPVGQRFEE